MASLLITVPTQVRISALSKLTTEIYSVLWVN